MMKQLKIDSKTRVISGLLLLIALGCTKKNPASMALESAMALRADAVATQSKVSLAASGPVRFFPQPPVLRYCPGTSSDDIQRCLDASNPGDTVALTAGQTYVATSKILMNKSNVTLTTAGNPVCYVTAAGQAALTDQCAKILASPNLSFYSSAANLSANGGVFQIGPDITWTDPNGVQYIPPHWGQQISGVVLRNVVIDGNKPSRPLDTTPNGLPACRFINDGLGNSPIMGQLGCANLRINNCADCDVEGIVTVDAAVIKSQLVVNIYANMAFNVPNLLFQNNLVWNRTMLNTPNGGTWDWTLSNGFEFDQISDGSDMASNPFSGSMVIAGNTAIDYADGQLVLAGSPGSRIYGRIFNNTVTNNRRILVPDGSQPSGAMSGGGILVYAQPIFSYYGKSDLNLGEGSTNDPTKTLIVSYNIVNDPHGVNATGLGISGNNVGGIFNAARVRGGMITANFAIGGRARSFRLAGTGPSDGQWLPPYTFFTSNVAQTGIPGEVNLASDNFAFCHDANNPVSFLSTTVTTFTATPNASCTGIDIWGGACAGTTVGYLFGNPLTIQPNYASLVGWHDEGACTN